MHESNTRRQPRVEVEVADGAALGGAEGRQVQRAALFAAAVAMLTRLPFVARRLWDHDSVQFALGVEKYDLAAHHPHPPGYPLYIAILKGLAAVGIGPLQGMVALSVLASALGAGLMVVLTARLVAAAARRERDGVGGWRLGPGAPRSAGTLAAALYIFNPLLWFYGELPLVYAVEGGMTVALAYAAHRMADGRVPFVAACGAFALAGGIRPSTLVLLLPLFLLGVWRAWRRGLRPGTLVAGGAAAMALGLAWLWPLLAAAGGVAAYRRIGQEHFNALLPYTSILYGAGWRALAHNLTIMTKWFLQGLLPAGVALAALWLSIWRRPAERSDPPLDPDLAAHRLPAGADAKGYGIPAGADTQRVAKVSGQPATSFRLRFAGLPLLAANRRFLAAWALPPALFFALFHITKAGYTLVYLPALLVAASLLAVPAMIRGQGESGEVEPSGRAAPGESSGVEPSGRAAPGEGGGIGPSGRTVTDEGGGTAPSGRTAQIRQAGLPPRAVIACVLAAACGAALFLFGADRRADQPRALALVRNEFNRSAIATYEHDLDSLVATLRLYPQAATVLATVELSGTGPAGPESFLYPWQRHLQWYLPEYEILHLVPEDHLAFVTRGHRPFHREGTTLVLPPSTRQILLVLSGPTGKRFELSPWPLRRIGETFYLVRVPFDGHLKLGPFDFESAVRRAA